jgi:hypothetical protein
MFSNTKTAKPVFRLAEISSELALPRNEIEVGPLCQPMSNLTLTRASKGRDGEWLADD